MTDPKRQFVGGVWITALGTLASRVLGLVRDMLTAALLGMSAGGVMDAFVVAFRVPNLLRRLFGEGALTASYLPVLTERLHHSRTSAWQLASVALVAMAAALAAVVLVGEGACFLLWQFYGSRPGLSLLVGLSALLLPYMIFICVAAQIAATLHALGNFRAPALVPIVLNVVWILAAWLVAPRWGDDPSAQAFVLAGCVLAAGVLQVAVQLPALLALGFRFQYNWAASRDAVAQILRAMGPMMLGLAITQINTLADSLIAWTLAAAPDQSGPVPWLGGAVNYPMRQGAAAAIYYGERLYQFPVGILGIAVATVVFPLLSRHAARGDHPRMGADLTLALRLVIFLAVPATAGLILLAGPLTQLLFERGQWDAASDTPRTARMIACYGLGVWAYCALPVVVRGFYAVGNYTTPVRIGAWSVALNLLLSLALVWPLAEAGLAIGTAAAASIQLVALLAALSRGGIRPAWSQLAATLLRALPATAAMTAAGYALLTRLPPGDDFLHQLTRVAAPIALCIALYLLLTLLLRAPELRLLTGGDGRREEKAK